uniref:Uncharacterized protein n=1 Tax=Anopheles melas TaxID=34690 RepID=A0A182UKS8_9DIPT
MLLHNLLMCRDSTNQGNEIALGTTSIQINTLVRNDPTPEVLLLPKMNAALGHGHARKLSKSFRTLLHHLQRKPSPPLRASRAVGRKEKGQGRQSFNAHDIAALQRDDGPKHTAL